jgi:small conductance mechanosensitive channel
MMKTNALKRKRICIVTVWLVGVLVILTSLFLMERSICLERGKAELLEEADIVAEQIPAIIVNDFYSQAGYLKLQFDKLKALSFALEFYEDAKQAEAFLGDFVQNADVDALAMFDRNGEMLYCSDPGFEIEIDITADSFDRMLKEKAFEKYVQALTYTDDYLLAAFSSDSEDTADYQLGWFVNGRWLLVMKGNKSEARYEMEDYFSWKNVLGRIRIDSDGCLLTIDENNGKILSFGTADVQGEPMESLDIIVEDGTKATEPKDLLSLFDDPDRVVKLRIAGRDYYACRVSVENTLMLALLPADDISGAALNAAIPLATLIVMITGLVMIYIILHVGAEKDLPDRKERGSLRGFPDKLGFCIVLAISVLLALSIYLQALTIYSDSLRYCRSKVNSMTELLESNRKALGILESLSDEEYFTRCRGAKVILDHAEKEDVDRDYLNSLCDAMSLRYIYLFDEDGKVTLTNSPYDRWSLDSESPFCDLLKGRPWILGKMQEDETTGEYEQLMGASLKDADGWTCGAVLFSMDPVERRTITDNLGMKSVFEEICLRDGAYVMTVDSKDLVIGFLAHAMDGSYETILDSDEDNQLPVSILGIDEELLRDNYNGDMVIENKRYCASVRILNDCYYIVLWPKHSIDRNSVYLVILSVVSSLILLLILYAVTYFQVKNAGVVVETGDSAGALAEASPETEGPQKTVRWTERLNRVNESFLQSLMEQKNALFEERWPKDGIKWKDKTVEQKFSVCVKAVMILVFALALIHTILAGEKSVWYYSFISDGSKGLNIFSLTTCVVGIYILVIVNVLGHQLLYLIARVVDARGETLCHLFDSIEGYILFIIGVFFCLSAIGVSFRTLSLTGGVAGVIFGIGCQNIVADILAGIIMAFEGVVCAGDFVSYNGQFGAVLSIGVRTTQIKYYGEVMIVRNNEFKNYIKMGAEEKSRITVDLWIDLREKLERVERIIDAEQQRLHDETRGFSWDESLEGPKYRGVKKIDENGYALNFAIYVKGKNYGWALRGLNRSLKYMCERNNIQLAMPQVVVSEPIQADHDVQESLDTPLETEKC